MRKVFFSIGLLVALLIAGFALKRYFKEPLYQSQAYIFGTLVDVSIYGESEQRAKALTNHIFQDFQNLHDHMHAWKEISEGKPSELGALNQAFKLSRQPVIISSELALMLTDAKRLSIKSKGLFNPAIGHLIRTWGFQRDEFSPVSIDADKIKILVHSHPSMADVVISDNTAFSSNPMVKLDLGGYAKGYALDIAAAYLRDNHVKNALINIGGNVIALGRHGTEPWRIGIQHPRLPSAMAALDLPDGWAIGTSGDYQRYFVLNGKRYCHIIDPRTGYPAQLSQSVTVLVPPQAHNQTQAGVLSDVASKPIFIETPENRSHAASALGIDHFLVVDAKSNILVSTKMLKKLHWLTPNVKFTEIP